MLPSSSRLPTKKRRLNSKSSNNGGPSDTVLPLVSPQLVSKSSKDPNRGLYPKPRSRLPRGALNNPTPAFQKASVLLREARRVVAKSKPTHQDPQCSTSKANEATDSVAKAVTNFHFRRLAKRKDLHSTRNIRRANLHETDVENSSSKINQFFKPIVASTSSKTDSDDDCYVPTVLPKKKEIDHNVFFRKLNSTYGLIGDIFKDPVEPPKDPVNYFERLPVDIIEEILCQIPYTDMMKYRLVCKQWNQIICNEHFMTWKKTYYCVKRGRISDLSKKCLFEVPGTIEDCFPILFKYMQSKFKKTEPTRVKDIMMHCPLAIAAKAMLEERFAEDFNKQEFSSWTIITAAVIISSTVQEMFHLYKCLSHAKSDISMCDLVEAFYCIAATMLYCKMHFKFNPGLHYRVFSIIQIIEEKQLIHESDQNQILKTPAALSGQRSIREYFPEPKKMTMTVEQMRLLNHRLAPKQIIKVIALAGSGKTTMLIRLAKRYPQIRFLNVVFNKSVCKEAKRKFPSNVVCLTAHALAYRTYGYHFRHKLTANLQLLDVMPLLKHYCESSLTLHVYARFVISAINLFNTADVHSFASLDSASIQTSLSDVSELVQARDILAIKKDAEVVWKLMVDEHNSAVKITHDTYLKLFQLSKPRLHQYRCILVDEAQDCNGAMLDIVLTQDSPVILVGDPYQQIYGFRGAHNALDSIQATHVFRLTKSFRFGSEIAYIATCILQMLKQQPNEMLFGTMNRSYFSGEVIGQYAIICRSNCQVFEEAVRLCCQNHRRMNEPKIVQAAFVGGLDGYNFDQILDIYNLKTKKGPIPIKDALLQRFKNYEEFALYARRSGDKDLLSKIELIDHYTTSIPDYVRLIKERCNYPIDVANVVFSTAHKAKGLEFDTVCLTDDYQITKSPFVYPRDADAKEEVNTLYVALTRAKRCVILPEKLVKTLTTGQEKFEYLAPSSKLLQNQASLTCVKCENNFIPHTVLLLCQQQMITSAGRLINGGPMCTKCSSDPFLRPEVHTHVAIMLMDPIHDVTHCSMKRISGPLPGDPPIQRDMPFLNGNEADNERLPFHIRMHEVVRVARLNIHILDDALRHGQIPMAYLPREQR